MDIVAPDHHPVGETMTTKLYMDVHRDVNGVDARAVAEAHKKDLEIQEAHGVNYLRYWLDEDEGAIFCLFEGPSKEAGKTVHREAHGLVTDEIYEVEEGR